MYYLHLIDEDTNVMVQKIFGTITQSPKAAHMWPIPLQVNPYLSQAPHESMFTSYNAFI